MRNEVQHMAGEEAAEAGRALIEELNTYFGTTGLDAGRLSRRLYKATDCGAWLAIDHRGLVLGSIVEGSDAEVGPMVLTMAEYLRMDEGDLDAWMDKAISEIEAEADFLWHEANEGGGFA